MKVVGRFKASLLWGSRWRYFATCLCAFALASCVAPNRYMGIALLPGAAEPTLQNLAARARAGEKEAQLDLGMRFEEGNGVPQDKARAMKLYRQAASDSGGTVWVYMPSPGNGVKGRVVPVYRGPRQVGLEDARVISKARDRIQHGN